MCIMLSWRSGVVSGCLACIVAVFGLQASVGVSIRHAAAAMTHAPTSAMLRAANLTSRSRSSQAGEALDRSARLTPGSLTRLPLTSESITASMSLTQINLDGFGDRYNTIAWSMLWWNGYLYVGTTRATLCLEAHSWGLPYPPPDPDLICTPDIADLPLQAEIWRYTPQLNHWDRVYQSPNDLPLPGRPGKFTARDIGYRDMIVYREPDGTEAMYVSAVSSRFLYPSLPPPRLLRSTDGMHFAPVPQDPGTVLGDLTANNFRSLAVYRNHLYVTAGDIWGDGVLYEATNPKAGDNAFQQVTPSGMRVFSTVIFNNQLYVGTTDIVYGYGVYRTDATGLPPYRFIPVVTRAANYPASPAIPHSVISMIVFQGSLYVGTDGPLDLIRIHPDDQSGSHRRQAPSDTLQAAKPVESAGRRVRLALQHSGLEDGRL